MRVKVHLFRGTGIIGWLIRWQTWGKYAHVAIEMDDVLYEAYEGPFPKGSVTATDLSDEWPSNRQKPSLTLIPEEELTSTELTSMKNFLEEAVGKKYDYWSILSFLSRGKERSWTTDKYFCSELVCSVFKWINKPLFRKVSCRKISPSDITYSLRLKDIE